MPISLITLYIPRKQRKCMDKKLVYEQLELAKNPADTKLVEESKIDVENILAGLEHKLFCQNAIRGVVA